MRFPHQPARRPPSKCLPRPPPLQPPQCAAAPHCCWAYGLRSQLWLQGRTQDKRARVVCRAKGLRRAREVRRAKGVRRARGVHRARGVRRAIYYSWCACQGARVMSRAKLVSPQIHPFIPAYPLLNAALPICSLPRTFPPSAQHRSAISHVSHTEAVANQEGCDCSAPANSPQHTKNVQQPIPGCRYTGM